MINKEMLEKDFEYFLEQKPLLLQSPKYYGKYIALQNKKIVGTDTKKDELIKSMIAKGFKMGTFIVQHVIENDDTIQRFFSRVQ